MKLTTTLQKTNRLRELEQELIAAKVYVSNQQQYYVNNDWNNASESPIRLVEIEISAWKHDADEVEQVHHGVKINNRYIVTPNGKWSDKFKKWYNYRNVDQLLLGLLA